MQIYKQLALLTVIFLTACSNNKRDFTGQPQTSVINSNLNKKNPAADKKTKSVKFTKLKKPIIIKTAARTIKDLLNHPPIVRYSTPGMLRYAVMLQNPISSITWSPLAGFSVSSGRQIYNITSKGLNRWHINAGLEHKVYISNNQEIIWSKDFKKIFKIIRNGRTGWSFNWPIEPLFKTGGEIYLADASNVATLSTSGSQKWMATIEGVRKIEGPFPCGNKVMFQGRRGKISVAVVITNSGAIFSEFSLPVASVLLGASNDCLPLVWSGEESGNEIFMLNSRGDTTWSHHLETVPVFNKLKDGYLLAIPHATSSIRLVKLDFNGNVKWNKKLPVTGRITSMNIFNKKGSTDVIAICKDVSSPCTRQNGNRGPFNTVIMGSKGHFSILERVIQGHINISNIADNGFITAVSRRENETELTMRDSFGSVLWTLNLPGRFSAGPYAGPYGAIYLGTCTGWSCTPPYRFLSVTAATPSKDEK